MFYFIFRNTGDYTIISGDVLKKYLMMHIMLLIYWVILLSCCKHIRDWWGWRGRGCSGWWGWGDVYVVRGEFLVCRDLSFPSRWVGPVPWHTASDCVLAGFTFICRSNLMIYIAQSIQHCLVRIVLAVSVPVCRGQMAATVKWGLGTAHKLLSMWLKFILDAIVNFVEG